jgi:membrane protease YdiL (CAAX protease family)
VSRLREFIRSLSPATEFWIVVVAAFAMPIAASLASVPDPAGGLTFEAGDLRALVVQEALVLLGLGWFLSVRGWDFAGLAAYPSWREVGEGAVFAIAFLLGWGLLWEIVRRLLAIPPALAGTDAYAPGLDWPTLLAICLINPLFEELLVCGYIVSALKPWQGPGLAIVMSVTIRVAYHTYQGLEGVLAVAILGLLFCLWFLRTRRLWPLVVAHGLLDFAGLANSTWT